MKNLGPQEWQKRWHNLFQTLRFVKDILNVIFVVLFYKLVFLFENLLNTTHQNDQADFISCQRWRCEE